MRFVFFTTSFTSLLLQMGCPGPEPILLSEQNTLVWEREVNAGSEIKDNVKLDERIGRIVFDLNAYEKHEQALKADDSYLGARFQYPTLYHPIHNDFRGDSSPPPLQRSHTKTAVLLAARLDQLLEQSPEKNILIELNGPAHEIGKLVLKGNSTLSAHTDLAFFEGDSKTGDKNLGEKKILSDLSKEIGCGIPSAVVLTPRGLKKVRHLLIPVHELPATQLSRYVGLNLRTECIPNNSSEAFFAGPQPKPIKMEKGVNLEENVLTYVLNLDRSPERLRKITEALHKANLDFVRFPAIDGKSPEFNLTQLIEDGLVSGWFAPGLPYHPVHQMGKDVDLSSDGMLGFGEVKYACIGDYWSYECVKILLGFGTVATGLSHVKMMEAHFNAFPQKHGLFFEDDVAIPATFKKDFNIALAELPEDWDIIYLDYHDSKCVPKDVSKYLAQYGDMKTCVPGDFAMLVNYKSAKKIIGLMKPLYEESDRQIMKYFGSVVNAYWTKVPLVRVDLGVSSDRKTTDQSSGK